MKICFLGDIVIKNKKAKLSELLFNKLMQCDVRIANFEAPLIETDKDKPIEKRGPNIFQTKLGVDFLKNSNINLVSLANNHILDYGKNALNYTVNILKENYINAFGAGFTFEDAYRPYIIESETEKIGIISASQAEFGVFKNENDSAGYAWINHPKINGIISETRKNVDFLCVFAHAGLEDIAYPLPEWRTRYKEFIDLGADCVIGSHPHIIQGYEIYHNKPVFYSLGNFCFESSNIDLEWNRSLAVICDTKGVNNIETIPCLIKGDVIDIDKSCETEKDIAERSALLQNEKLYIQKMDKIAEELWNEYYASYYIWHYPRIENISAKQLVKILTNRIIRRKKAVDYVNYIDKTMLLHNIQIETHRWVVERYLYNNNVKNGY